MGDVHLLELAIWSDNGNMEMPIVRWLELVIWHMIKVSARCSLVRIGPSTFGIR